MITFFLHLKLEEMELDRKCSIRSIQGIRQDTEKLYLTSCGAKTDILQKMNNIEEMIRVSESSEDYESHSSSPKHTLLSRSKSQPNFLINISNEGHIEDESYSANESVRDHDIGLLNRSRFGALKMSKTISFSQIDHSDRSSSTDSSCKNYKNAPQQKRQSRQLVVFSETDSEDDERNVIDSDRLTSIERFLIAWGLREYLNT